MWPPLDICACEEVGVHPKAEAVVKDDGELEVKPDNTDAKVAIENDEDVDATDLGRIL